MNAATLSPVRIFCRTSQVNAAATVMSCAAQGDFVHLFCIDDPPCTLKEYRDLAARTELAREDSMENLGSELSRREAVAGARDALDAIVRKISVHQGLQRQLAPLRGWRRRNLDISRRNKETGGELAVFLFAHDAEGVSSKYPDMEAEAGVEDGQEFSEVAPRSMRRLYFISKEEAVQFPLDSGGQEVIRYSDLGDLAFQAWHRFHQSDVGIHEYVDVCSGDFKDILYGLYFALSHRRPLRIVGNVSREIMDIHARHAWASDAHEVVLVETVPEAANLLAPMYACQFGVPMFSITAPNEAVVKEALANYERQSLETLKGWKIIGAHRDELSEDKRLNQRELDILVSGRESSKEYVDKLKFSADELLSLFRRLLASEDHEKSLSAVRAAASGAIDEEVVHSVRDRGVTIFCGQTPYTMIRKADSDWSRKPVGHVTGDKCLLLFNELFPSPRNPDLEAFNLVIDAGNFDTDETGSVLAELDHHGAHTILLEGRSASLDGLDFVARFLQMDIIFINTHGGPDEILLGGIPYPSNLIGQWLHLPSAPIVINNSCQSWVGVGRQFVGMGARGYLGTLWSVEEKLAARFARHAMVSMISNSRTAAQAIADFDDQHSDAYAYIFVGTARGGSFKAGSDGQDDQQAVCMRYATELAQLIVSVPKEGRDIRSLVSALHKEFLFFLEKLMPQALPPDLEKRLLELQLVLYAACPELVNTKISDIDAVYEKLLDLVDGDSAAGMAKRRVMLHQSYISVLLHRGDAYKAMLASRNAVRDSDATGDKVVRGQARLQLAEILQMTGQFEEAMQWLRQAHDQLQENKTLVLVVDGRLCQLLKRMNQFDEALRYAKEGLEVSRAYGEKREELAFLGDVAKLLTILGEINSAIATAKSMLNLANRMQNELGGLKARGVLANALMANNCWDEAEALVKPAIEIAVKLNDKREMASFCMDLSEIKKQQKKLEESFVWAWQACCLYRENGYLDAQAAIIPVFHQLLMDIKNWAAFVRVAAEYSQMLPYYTEEVQRNVLLVLVSAGRHAVSWSDRDDVAQGLGYLAFLLKKTTKMEKQTDVMRFIVAFIDMLNFWIHGHRKMATEIAVFLEEVSDHTAEFVVLVNQRRPPASYWKRFVRAGRRLAVSKWWFSRFSGESVAKR